MILLIFVYHKLALALLLSDVKDVSSKIDDLLHVTDGKWLC